MIDEYIEGNHAALDRALAGWIREFYGNHGLRLGSVPVERIRLEPPLLDGGDGRLAENKVSTHNLQILDVAVAPDRGLQNYRPLQFLRQRLGGIRRGSALHQKKPL